MSAADTLLPQGVSQRGDLRRRAGLAVAVAWVLTHLWIASPLPYIFGDALGSWVIINDTQHRGLMLGFALCLAFLLFEPRRLKLPPAADLALAALAAVAGSFVAWNYGYLSQHPRDPGAFSQAVGIIGMVLLFLACLRVFGWFGWILLSLLAFIHWGPLAFGVPPWPDVREVGSLVNLHWFGTESIFGIVLGIVTSFGMPLVILGVGYDLMGCGRLLAKGILRPLPPDVPRDDLAGQSRIARRLWALAALYVLFGGWLFAYDAGERLAFGQIGVPLVLGFPVYVVFLGIAWSSQATDDAPRRARRLAIGAGGMLLGFVPILSVGLTLAYSLFEVLFGGLSIRLPGLAGSLAAPVLFLALGLLLIVVAKRPAGAVQRERWLNALMLLPLLLFFWGFGVDRLSPGLSAVYADLLLLVVMAGIVWVGGRDMASGTSGQGFAAACFLPLCHSVARVMVRVVIFAALYGMVIPFAYFWATALEVMLD